MNELIYEPVRRMLEEKRSGWSYVFENNLLKINTNDNFVDPEIIREIRNLGFRIDEIGYLKQFGIIFLIVEGSLE